MTHGKECFKDEMRIEDMDSHVNAAIIRFFNMI